MSTQAPSPARAARDRSSFARLVVVAVAASLSLSVGVAAAHGHESSGPTPHQCAICQVDQQPGVQAIPSTGPPFLDVFVSERHIDATGQPPARTPRRHYQSRAPPA